MTPKTELKIYKFLSNVNILEETKYIGTNEIHYFKNYLFIKFPSNLHF